MLFNGGTEIDMDCNITRTNISTCKTVLENFTEEKIDFDIVIPDYKSAAFRILKCDVIPSVSSKVTEGDRLIIEGMCKVNINYTDEETGMMKSISETTPFSLNEKLEGEHEGLRTKIKLRTTNVICRLQNSRRISVKAIIGIALKVMGNCELSVIDSIDDCEIESNFSENDCSIYINCGDVGFHMNSEIELNDSVKDILHSEAVIKIKDSKVINGKVIIKGDTKVSCLYSYGDSISDVNSVSQVIPFSEVIDVSGANDDFKCDCECSIVSVRADLSEGDNIINLDIEAIACASVYKNVSVKLLKDAYSRKNDIDVKTKQINIESFEKEYTISHLLNQNIDLEMSESRIIDVLSKAAVKNISLNNQSLLIEGDLYTTVYAHNGEEYKIIDKAIPFNVSKEISGINNDVRCEADISVESIDYSMRKDGVLDIESQLEISLLVFMKNSFYVIDEINVNYDSEHTDKKSKVVLYYADKGEELWDIAKKYLTSVEIIKRDNQLEENVVNTDRMILVSQK